MFFCVSYVRAYFFRTFQWIIWGLISVIYFLCSSALISGLSYRGGGTRIGTAIEYAKEHFLIASPDPDRTKVMFIVTDGDSGDDPKYAADAAR